MIPIRNCDKISCAIHAPDRSSESRMKTAGILGVFQGLKTKSQANEASGNVQVIFEKFLNTNQQMKVKTMKKLLFAVMLVLLLLVTASCTKANITSPAQLNKQEIKVGVSQGSAAEAAVMSELPEATIIYYTDNLLGYTAVAQGKLDAYVHDLVQMQLTIDNGLTGVHLLPEVMDETVKIAVGISDVSKISDLTEKTNRFIAEVKADGTLDDMYRRWVLEGNGVMPEIPTPDNPKIHLTVGTTGNVPPYSYYEGSGLTGYDIELAYRFAAWLGADVSFQIYDFDGIIPAAKSGKVDVIMSNLQYLPERSKELPFSDILYEEKLGIMVRGDAPAIGDVSSVSDGIDMDIAPAYAAYNGKRVAVQTGTISGEVALSVIPDLEVNYFNTQTDCLAALRAGKVDAWCYEEPGIRFLMIDNKDLAIYGGKLDESSLAAVFAKTAKGQELCDEYNTFLEEIWADGTMAEIDDIWFGTDDGKRTVLDYEALSDTNGTLRMAVDASILPFAYVKDNRVVGYDVDIAARFCQARGYRLEVVPMDFAGILPAVQSDKCDFAACCITVTEERAESVLFSSPNYHSGTVMAVLKNETDAVVTGAYTSLSQLDGARIGVQTGTTFDQIVLETLPNAKISYFNTYPDMAAAVEANKIDGFPGDEPVLQLMAAEDPKLTILSERMDSFEFGFVLPKTEAGEALLAELNAWIATMQESGELQKIVRKWTEGPEADKTIPDYAAFPATKGTLRMATEGAYAPMNYYRENEVVGMEIDLAAQFCQANGYGLVVEAMNFDGILPAVQAGKADFAAAGISITEERKESVNFSAPYYTGGTVMAVLKAEEALSVIPTDTQQEEGFLDGIRSSFNKTFIREGRWKLFLEGIGTTLLITLLSILFGTLLGFLVFMLCRNGNILANGVTRFCVWLVTGTPMVVLLMILYYIIFGSVAISGIAVAVIGFTLTFGAAVYGLLKMGVGTIDRGQYEAAYALGHSNRHTFFKIILPQAIPHVLPAYQGEIVGLIKATAIVGYIAVQDLTKMGDIVRSRTYEAFFPLIAVTVIYFVLEGLLSFAVSRVRVSIDPKKRKREKILKGVKTDD